MSELDSIADEVIFAVADALGADPVTMDPLAETIDPDALESLARSEHVEVRFEYHGYHVSVSGPDEIELRRA